jgi:hypothetical protein
VGGDAAVADDRAHASFSEWSTDAPAACDAPDAHADDAPSLYGRFSYCELLDIFLLSFRTLET